MNAPADKPSARYKNPAVRDLAWACFSEPLLRCSGLPDVPYQLRNCTLLLTEQRRAWLEQLDREPQALLEHLSAARTSRLGLYFESLWHFLLNSDCEVELVAHNLPVREAGRTVGEFDCLYYCHRRQIHVHLELAVKFYLQCAGSSGARWADWVGPNQEDRLDLKLNRLLDHQLRLGEHPAARESLARLGVAGLERELELKGRLFHLAGARHQPPPAFPAAREPHWHCTLGQLEALLPRRRSFRPLARNAWLAPLESTEQDTVPARTLLERLQAQLGPGSRPQLVASLDERGNERERFFVTPDGWGGRP